MGISNLISSLLGGCHLHVQTNQRIFSGNDRNTARICRVNSTSHTNIRKSVIGMMSSTPLEVERQLGHLAGKL